VGGATNTGGTAGSGTAGTAGTAGNVGTVGPLTPPSEEEIACTKNSDCSFELEACCFCYTYSVGDLAAVNTRYAESYRNRVCADTSSCSPCGSWPRDVAPNVVATCRAGRCAVVDILETELTACDTEADCKFRSSRCCGCSESAGSGLVIAIGVDQDAAYEALRCDPGAACAECSATIPEAPDFYQACFGGHCGIGTPPPTHVR